MRQSIFEFVLSSPLHIAGLALSIYGLAIAIEGVTTRTGLATNPRRNHSWDVIALGFAVTAFMWWAAWQGVNAV